MYLCKLGAHLAEERIKIYVWYFSIMLSQQQKQIVMQGSPSKSPDPIHKVICNEHLGNQCGAQSFSGTTMCE